MSVETGRQTEAEFLDLINSVLDPDTRRRYGERSAVVKCASALGILTSSAVRLDEQERIVWKTDPEEVRRRLDFVTRMKKTRHLSFFDAINLYFTQAPRPEATGQHKGPGPG